MFCSHVSTPAHVAVFIVEMESDLFLLRRQSHRKAHSLHGGAHSAELRLSASERVIARVVQV